MLFLPPIKKKPKKSLWRVLFQTVGMLLMALLLALLLKNCLNFQPKPREVKVVSDATIEVAPYDTQSMNKLIEREVGTAPTYDSQLLEMLSDADYDLYEEPLPENIIETPQPVTVPAKDMPKIAIVVDDMGISVKRTADIISLQFPLTSSFLTYGTHLPEQLAQAQNNGHEVMLHIPMQAKGNAAVAPNVLMVDMWDKTIKKNLEKMLKNFAAIKGANNHMGSAFTENEGKMEAVMEVLKKHQLFFLDSKTSNHSVAKTAAEKMGVKYATRNVFLDNENNLEYINKQLALTEKIARKKGFAIAICHPKTETFKALQKWLATLPEKNLQLVHLSQLVK